jgi:hypothetical protein
MVAGRSECTYEGASDSISRDLTAGGHLPQGTGGRRQPVGWPRVMSSHPRQRTRMTLSALPWGFCAMTSLYASSKGASWASSACSGLTISIHDTLSSAIPLLLAMRELRVRRGGPRARGGRADRESGVRHTQVRTPITTIHLR